MKLLNSKLILSTSLITALTDASIVAKDSKQPSDFNKNKYLKLGFDKYVGESFDKSSKDSLQKRAEYAIFNLTNQASFYSVELAIGTPSQNVTVLVDTGSSDLWVTGSDNPLCSTDSSDDDDDSYAFKKKRAETIVVTEEATITENGNNLDGLDPFGWLGGSTATSGSFETSFPSSSSSSGDFDCSEYGTFNTNDSSTWSSNHTSFFISYGDSSVAEGVWGQDVLSISDVDVSGVSFAVANYTNSTVGVLGIGLSGLETTYSGTSSSESYIYENLPMLLKSSGVIDTIAYSLFLNEKSDTTGNLLFGAVDHSKYSGSLYTLPIVNVYASEGYKNPLEFDVTMYGLGISTSDSNTTIATMKIPALLDSGTTIVYFPETLLELVADQLGASYSDELGFYAMSCVSSSDDTEFVFDFGGFHITVPLSDFLIRVSGSECILAMAAQDDESIILGDYFLTNAYVVYDLENYEISMAQANYDSEDEDIEVISSTVPSAVKAASYSNSWSSTGSITSGGDIFTVASNSTATNSVTTTKSSSSKTSSGHSTTDSSSRKSNAGSGISYASYLLMASITFVLSYLL
ncbi:hypothetical protein KAFR_0B05710 [Kazachstania africana CBS 2517]|uniref:Peptidase A1 domain-containing protein n=1 Tax=Kazachstania africana (strain ATCC 22294 / BCRC 22015 / CBS 2517 / CECT 1963 / NBRC 1671 / NRRL Y-8276) TaxID=1071382 RepID=H2AR67_KAZAF|nr:hypothetical protein KAFR_0B05710 [Kazachstania africana CBS 2517]CCF56867.1 hypothetical protein KAFR_0B05710 [Kazachstania africana CBS 2517]